MKQNGANGRPWDVEADGDSHVGIDTMVLNPFHFGADRHPTANALEHSAQRGAGRRSGNAFTF
jgi:hypothetical protein